MKRNELNGKGARGFVRKTALQDLAEKMEALTPAQRKVADYILKFPMEAAFLTIEQLAGLTSVSVATIIRLAYSLGYDGYTQFQKALQALLRDQISPPNRLEANLKRIGKNKLLINCAELQIKNIRKTVEILSEENIDQAFNLIFESRKIYIIGIRSSLAVADYLNEGFNRLGLDCEMLAPETGRLQAVVARLTPEDLLIAISMPRYAKRTLEVVNLARKKQAKILAITDAYSSPIALMADVFLGCAFESLAFHHSELGAMFVADYLITGVAAKDSAKTKQKLEELEKVVDEFEANVIKS